MLPREKSSISRPWTISQAPFLEVTGKDGDQALGHAVGAVGDDAPSRSSRPRRCR